MARKVQYEFGVDMAAYAKSMRAALSTAGQLDKAFNNLLRSVRQLENAAIKMTVDTSALDRARGDINAIDGSTPDVTVNVDTSQLDRAEGDVEALDGATPDVTVQADTSELDNAESKVSTIDGATPNVEIQVDDSSLQAARTEVQGLFSNIQLTFDVGQIPGMVRNIPSAITGAPIVSTLVDAENAMRQLESSTEFTRGELGGIGQIIQDVWVEGFAETQTEVGAVAAKAIQAGLDIQEAGIATRNAFIIAAQTGEDVNAILSAQTTLVNSGLVPGYQEAGDLLSSGFKTGLNNAGDFLDTIKEYSQDFSDLRVTGQEFFSILGSGLAGGAYNTDKVADAFRELKIRIATALSTGAGTEFEGLQTLGLVDEAQAFADGEITGREFISGAIAAMNESGNLDAAVTGLFGSPLEDIGTGVFENIGARLQGGFFFEGAGGTVDETAATLGNTLSAQLTSAARVFEAELSSAVRVSGAPLTEIVKNATEGLRTFVTEVASGTSIPDALEIALKAPGLSEDIRQLQANIGGFIIELQLTIADFLTGLGKGDAAAGLRSSAAAAAQGQLAFDLQFLDPDSTAESIATALRRGVDQSGIDEAIIEAGSHLIDDEQAKKFQLILEELAGTAFLPTTITAGGLLQQSQSQLIPVDPDEITQTMGIIESAIGENWFSNQWADFGEAITFDTDALYESATGIETLGTRTAESDDALISYGDTISGTGDKLTTLGDRAGMFETKTSTAFETAATRAEVAMDRIVASVIEAQTVMAGAGIDVTAYAAYVFGSGAGTGTFESSENPEHRATGGGVNAGQPYRVGEHGWEYFIPGMDGAIIPHDISAALANLPMGGGGSSTINNTVNLYSTMNNPTQAASVGAANELSRQARGYF